MFNTIKRNAIDKNYLPKFAALASKAGSYGTHEYCEREREFKRELETATNNRELQAIAAKWLQS